jgi:methylphosphotriester-DNA--protein-cysteine methyltransferase|nr:MAG: Metal binding domain of Ada [Bacteriophage sp.]UWG77008.1 MAG: Metal binding domain of Ada [Bacteriophage sp.]
MFKQIKKKTAIILLTLVTLLMTLNIATATTYIGSSQSNKFHYTDCRWAKKINPDNAIYFNSREEAYSYGYVPCKVCKP